MRLMYLFLPCTWFPYLVRFVIRYRTGTVGKTEEERENFYENLRSQISERHTFCGLKVEEEGARRKQLIGGEGGGGSAREELFYYYYF